MFEDDSEDMRLFSALMLARIGSSNTEPSLGLYQNVQDIKKAFQRWTAVYPMQYSGHLTEVARDIHFQLACIGVLLWEAFIWLREGHWLGLSVTDAFYWSGIYRIPASISIDGWVGVSRIINWPLNWFIERSLPTGCLFLSIAFGIVAIFTGRFDVPAETEE